MEEPQGSPVYSLEQPPHPGSGEGTLRTSCVSTTLELLQGKTEEGCTHPRIPLSRSQTEHTVPNLVPGPASSNSHHKEVAPHCGGIHGFGHMEVNFLISQLIFTCFSCKSLGLSVQLALSPHGMRNKPGQQRFNPSQSRKDGMTSQARKYPGSEGTSLLMALLPWLQSSFTSSWHSLLKEKLIFLRISSPAQLTGTITCFALSGLYYGKHVLIQELGNLCTTRIFLS